MRRLLTLPLPIPALVPGSTLSPSLTLIYNWSSGSTFLKTMAAISIPARTPWPLTRRLPCPFSSGGTRAWVVISPQARSSARARSTVFSASSEKCTLLPAEDDVFLPEGGGVGEVGAVVCPPALLPEEGRLYQEPAHQDQVPFLSLGAGEPGLKPPLPRRQLLGRLFKPLPGADDARLLPEKVLEMGGILQGTEGQFPLRQGMALFGGGGGGVGVCLLGVLDYPPGKDYGLQEGVGCQAVGPVKPCAGAFPGGEEAGDIGLPPGVGADPPHDVVGGGGHGDGGEGDIQAPVQAEAVDVGEAGDDGPGG